MLELQNHAISPARDIIIGSLCRAKDEAGNIVAGHFLLVLAVGDEVEHDVEVGDKVAVDPDSVYYIADFAAVADEDILAIIKLTEPECDCDECPGDASDDRCAILDEIDKEIAYQDEVWAGHNDDDKTEDDWVRHITEYASNTGEAKERELPDGSNRDFRTRMLKVAALAIRAIESVDRQAEFLVNDDILELNLAQEN